MHGGVTHLGTFRALVHGFEVTVEGDPPVDIAAVLGGLVDPRAASTTTYGFRYPAHRSDDGVLLEDGVEISSGTTRTLLQILISRLGLAIGRTAPSLTIHANTVRVGEGTILLAGPSGHGKSTLTARLLLGGAALVAEDISMPDRRTLEVAGYHRPLGLSEASFEVLGIPIPPAAGEPCGCGGKVLAAAEHLGSTVTGPARPTVVGFVDHTSDTLIRLSPATAVARVLAMGIAPTPDPERDLDALVRLLAGADCFAIGTADLDQAADWAGQLAANTPTAVPTLVERHGERIDVYAGTEAVIVEAEESHLLNQSATAVWLLHLEGLDRDEIAAELEVDAAVVDAAFEELADVVPPSGQ